MKPMKRLAEPGEDDQIIQRFEVEFGMPVAITPEHQRKLYAVISEIIDAPVNQLEEGVHWLAGGGSKPSYSKTDAAFLGKPIDPSAPDMGEPEYDSDVLYFESCARAFVSEKERDRVLSRRAKEAAAEETCMTCHGTRECGWGLTAGGIPYAMVPCITCRHPQYVEATAALVSKLRAHSERV